MSKTIKATEITKITIFDDKQTIRIYFKDGEVIDAKII